MTLVIVISLCIFLTAPAARAQVASATLSGTVRDASDATIGGARISGTDSATGLARETVTDVLGRYRFEQPAAGIYRLTAEKPGFGEIFTSGDPRRMQFALRYDF
jgi:hypothetical protein